MAKSLLDYCIERDEFELLAQWDKEKNGELSPRDVSHGSHKKYGGSVHLPISGRLLCIQEPEQALDVRTAPARRPFRFQRRWQLSFPS